MARHFVAASQQYLQRVGVPVSAVPLTLAAWIRTPTPTQDSAPVVTLCHTTSNGFFFLGLYGSSGDPQAQAYDGTTSGQAIASGAVAANTWTHVCAVFASLSAQAVLLNGANKGTAAATTGPPTLNVTTVGAVALNGTLPFSGCWDGDLAEVAMYNAALSDAEVAQLAAGAKATSVRLGNLMAYYPLLGMASPEPDVMGGTPLTLVNGPTPAPHPPILSGAAGGMFQVF